MDQGSYRFGPENGAYYLIVVDRYNKWLEICIRKKPTFTVTIEFLHELSARYGVPDTIVSDKGTQFTAY